MTFPDRLQDSGLPYAMLFARLVHPGVFVLDATGSPEFASAGACELFGVPDLDALRTHWAQLHRPLGIGDWPHLLPESAAFCGRADLATPRGPRAVRFEVHGIDGAGARRAVLIRDRARLLPSDRVLLLASEAQTNPHVTTSLVHAAKGPLNNFNLTLALFAGHVARSGESPPAPDAIVRQNRYIGTLQSEAARLAACIDDIHALTVAVDAGSAPIDLAAMSHDGARVLRHGAMVREVELDLEAPDVPVMANGDEALVRRALLALAICIIGLTSHGGRVRWRVAQDDGEADPSILFETTEPALPPALVATLFSLSCTTGSDYAAAIAARLIIEAQRGDVILCDDKGSPQGILLRIPAHR